MKKMAEVAMFLCAGVLPAVALAQPPHRAIDPDVPAKVRQLYAFVGYWPGSAVLEQTGAPPLHLEGYQQCEIVARGWSIQCVGRFTNDVFELNESFQGAYDAATDSIHWQVMYSTGPQAFTVTGNFNADGTALGLSRSAETPAGTFLETGTWTFLTPWHRALEIHGTLAGETTHRITADLRRAKKKHRKSR